MKFGKNNIGFGLLMMFFFMLYGFLLIYLRDFAPGKEEWILNYANGKHFESRLAHVHGNLFAFLNILIGFLLIKLPYAKNSARVISTLGMGGLLMPLGILMEVYFNFPPLFVLAGAISISTSILFMAIHTFKLKIL